MRSHRAIAALILAALVAPAAWAQVLNEGLSGAWFDPATPGQGILIDVNEELDLFFLAWFTFEVDGATDNARGRVGSKIGDPAHRWMTAQGALAEVADGLVLSIAAGGAFDSSRPVAIAPTGSVSLSFDSCTSGRMDYAIDDGPTGTVPLVRLTEDVFCEAIVESRAPRVTIRYVGNQGVLVTNGTDGVLIDAIGALGNNTFVPVPAALQASIQALEPPFDVTRAVLVTHNHSDHFNTGPTVDFLQASGAPLYFPNQGRNQFSQVGDQVAAINPPRFGAASASHAGVDLTIVGTRHFNQFGNDFSGVDNYAYLVEVGGKRVLHCGDIDYARDNFQAIRDAIGDPPDAVILPTFNLLVNRVNADLVAEFFPGAQVIAAHLRTGGSLQFDRTAVNRDYPDAVVFTSPGQEVELR